MAQTVEELEAARIRRLVEAFGEVPPLWAWSPRVHPYDMHWRMGGGEEYAGLFWAWTESRSWTLDERVAYVRRWDPPPSWLEWVAGFLWPSDSDDECDEVTHERFAQMASWGLGSRDDWSRCFDVEPDAYPLPEDTSSRWIEAGARAGVLDP